VPNGFIDSAGLWQIVQCFDLGSSDQYQWSLRTAFTITSLLMRTDHLTLAPGLMMPPAGVVIDEADKFVDQLVSKGLLKTLHEPDPAIVKQSILKSKQWIGRSPNLDSVRIAVERMLADEENCLPWLDWSAHKAWRWHSTRLLGLFDKTYMDYIARILNIDIKEAMDLHTRSTDPSELDNLIRQQTYDYWLMAKAYLASAIIRGRYHEEVSRATGLQILHHPLRKIVTMTGTQKPIEFEMTNTAEFLARLIVIGAARQKSLRQRLDCWIENVMKVKMVLNRRVVGLERRPTDNAAVESAVLVARQAAIEVSSRHLDRFIGIFASLGIGALTAIFLEPWLGVPAGVGANAALKKTGFPAKLRQKFHAHGAKLKDLAAGRLDSKWERASHNII
jgi:hypothetical protein